MEIVGIAKHLQLDMDRVTSKGSIGFQMDCPKLEENKGSCGKRCGDCQFANELHQKFLELGRMTITGPVGKFEANTILCINHKQEAKLSTVVGIVSVGLMNCED